MVEENLNINNNSSAIPGAPPINEPPAPVNEPSENLAAPLESSPLPAPPAGPIANDEANGNNPAPDSAEETGSTAISPPSPAEPRPINPAPAPAASLPDIPAAINPIPAPANNFNLIKSLLSKARLKIQERRQTGLNKILLALKEKGALSNGDLRKIIKKSRITTHRYLNLLERQGLVRQVGRAGRDVFYELIKK